MFEKIISVFRKTPASDARKQYKLSSPKPEFSFSDLDPKQQKNIKLLQQDPEISDRQQTEK